MAPALLEHHVVGTPMLPWRLPHITLPYNLQYYGTRTAPPASPPYPPPQELANANHIICSAARSPELANMNSAAVEIGCHTMATSSNYVSSIPENNNHEQFQQAEQQQQTPEINGYQQRHDYDK